MKVMRTELENKYDQLFTKYNIEKPLDAKTINSAIKSSLKDFLKNVNNPAIYCYGGHTKMLMADFIFELKKVKIIIDNYNYEASSGEEGFKFICDDDIETSKIDAIVISSFKFRNQIKKRLEEEHPDVPYLDIYDKIAEAGINLKSDYYYSNHPFHHYKMLNMLQDQFDKSEELEKEDIIKQIIGEYIRIKDFGRAISWAKKSNQLSESEYIRELLADLNDLYELTLFGYGKIEKNNVLMLCMDGFRRRDFIEDRIPKIYKQVGEEWIYFKNTYSYSTSTFESLLPVYSENTDQRTNYFDRNFTSDVNCRFVVKAIEQKRDIYFYTDIEHMVESDSIRYTDTFQTVSEKLWSFLLDSVDCKNGLFYIHSLYETHYSFCNPYTKGKMISEGTALLFDFLPQKGEKLRTDYVKQQKDALRYIDDLLSPVLKRLSCSILLFADHGNLILENGCQLRDIKHTKYLLDEEWIQIPLAVKLPKKEKGMVEGLHSLMELNTMVVSLLENDYKTAEPSQIIKCGRSELYNPDFKFLYRKVGAEQYLLSFEAFLFSEGYKLIIFSNGMVELYETEDDFLLNDDVKKNELLSRVKDQITVYEDWAR